MVSIDERPTDVNDRKIPGHWEGDLIIGKAGASAAATLVERTTRFLAILALPLGRGSDAVADAVIEHTSVLPAMFRKSLTWDQGSEMARHAHIAAATDIKIYFAHPHSPWERGSNEQTNRMIRRYLPKSTPITDHQPLPDSHRRRTQRDPPQSPRLAHPERSLRAPTEQPCCLDGLTLPSNDLRFGEHLIDVVGLHLAPPENSIVLCLDEKSSVGGAGPHAAVSADGQGPRGDDDP